MKTRRIVNWRRRWHDRHPVYGPISKQTYDAIQMIRGQLERELALAPSFTRMAALAYDRDISLQMVGLGNVAHIPNLTRGN